MKKQSAKFILSIFVIAIFAIASKAEISSIQLEELTKNSDLIFVGRVISVSTIDEEEIAKIEVLKKYKGRAQNQVFISVSRTWTCDVSNAIVGETALFFLSKYRIRPTLQRNLEETCKLKKKIDSEIGTNDFYYISHSGYGRMPIEKKNGLDNVSILYGQVILPKKIKVSEKYVEKYTSINLAKLEEVTDEVVKHSKQKQIQEWDELLETDENFKQILVYKKMSDEKFGEVCNAKPIPTQVETQVENCETEDLSFFEKILNFIFG